MALLKFRKMLMILFITVKKLFAKAKLYHMRQSSGKRKMRIDRQEPIPEVPSLEHSPEKEWRMRLLQIHGIG